MPETLTESTFVLGSADLMRDMTKERPLEVFSPIVLDFWAEVSSYLLTDKKARSLSDVVTFAFFCRRAQLFGLKERYGDLGLRWGRGVIFHITPSNVPVMFAFSLLAGMLAGNSNIVRVSSREFEQVDVICSAMERTLRQERFAALRNRLCILRYGRDADRNAELSALADVRVIWGGDDTIAEIRKAGLPARANDITFANRYSFALLSADAVVAAGDLGRLARAFYNDTYLFDQNACSAPRLVLWQGDNKTVEAAKACFWPALESCLNDYAIDGVVAVDKLSTFCRHASDNAGVRLVPAQTNKLWRVEVERLSRDIESHCCAGGYFVECIVADLSELAMVVSRKYQTMTYFGYSKEQLEALLRMERFLGIDRVVPVGKATDFELTWDGHDLIRALSRECTLL